MAKGDARFHLWYTLDTPPAGWTFSSGFVSAAMLKDHMPPPATDTLILMCGPNPMVQRACVPALLSLGYEENMMDALGTPLHVPAVPANPKP